MPQSRRLLATLSSIPTATPSPTLVPPYAHSGPSSSSSSSSSSPSSPNSSGRTGASRASLRAPYAHSIKPIRPAKALTAPYDYTYTASTSGTFTGLSSAQAHERWAAWAREQLAAPSAAIALWEETLERLAVMAETQAQAQAAAASSSGAGAAVQEVSAIDVPAFLRDEARVARIKEAGSLVVRDAVPDHLALGWAREVADELRARGGDATYWHPALLAARSNPSLLSTISSVMSAITPYNGHEAFMQVQAVREGLGAVEGVGRVMDMADIWAIDESIAPISPLHSALALTPSPTPLSIPSSILASTYRTLRPLFQPLRSRISFYSGAEYLASSNWSIISPASIPLGPSSSSADSPTGPTSPAGLNAAAAAAYEASLASLSADLSALTSAATDLPHLAPALSQAISLNPGDLILYHRHLPIQSAAQAFLPLTMLPNSSANAEYVQAQRGAYERGLPPPAEAQQGDAGGAKRAGEERAVRVEKTNGAEGVSGWRGKKVMGY